MELKTPSSYLNRPFERFELNQIENFKKVVNSFNLGKDSEFEYEIDAIGFLNHHDNNWMKQIIEDHNQGYTLMWLFDIALRKPKNTIECLVPTSLVNSYGLENIQNVCIEFRKCKRVTTIHKCKTTGDIGKFNLLQIDEFKIVNPVKLRSVTSNESREAQKIRDEILFDELHVETPIYVKMSILDSLFLSPMIKSRSGIESNTLLSNHSAGRELVNLDNYNQLIKSLIPPEISNCHLDTIRHEPVHYKIESLNETFQIFPAYHTSNFHFNAECNPLKRENDFVKFRNMSNTEVGINHQTRFNSFLSRKLLMDKLMVSEFFYIQEHLPTQKITDMGRSFSLLKDNSELIYNDYVSRLFSQIKIEPLSVSENQLIREMATDHCAEIGYKIKQSNDKYLSAIERILKGKLHRVKAILPRTGVNLGTNAGFDYLQNIQLNFDDIRQSNDYTYLSGKGANNQKISRIMNNHGRSVIITELKVRGGSCLQNDLINELMTLGHEPKDILKELNNLLKACILWKSQGTINLIDMSI